MSEDGEQLVQFQPDQNLDVMRFDNEASILLADPNHPAIDRSERAAVDTLHIRYTQDDQETFGLILRYDHERHGWRISQHQTFNADDIPETPLAFLPDPLQADDEAEASVRA